MDKQPTPQTLEVGEIAVNNGVSGSTDRSFLSIKNANNKIVRFSTDEQMITWMEKKEVIPYVGYVRGDAGPSATSGDTPTADSMGSYGISNNDLLNNTSEIVIKLNQVVAGNTVKHDKVNTKKDRYSKDINPTTDAGLTDGAGFFIDMSRYAMRGGNPAFSSLTVTDKTDLSGNTTITDGDGTGTRTGKTLTIKMTNEIDNVSARTTTIGTEVLNVTGTTTETHNGNVAINNKSNVIENTTGTTTIDRQGAVSTNNRNNVTEVTSGNTVINHKGTTNYNYTGGTTLSGSTLESTTTGNTSIHADGAVGITAVGNITAVSSESDIYITANDDLSATAGDIAAFKGVNKTNIGIDTEGDEDSVVTNIYGKTINTRANTADTRVTSAYTSAVTVSENITTENSNITTLNADIETANIDIDTANTQVGEANISADTLTLSGNSLVIRETMNLNYSGGSLASTTTGDTNFVSKGNTSALTIGDTTIESNGAGKSVTIKETGANGVVNIQTNANSGVTNIESLGDTGKININANTTNGEINAKAKSITNSATTATTKAEQANITGSTSVNISGGTINTNANTANTNAASAYTNVTSATTTIGTANTQVSSAKTVISTANTSATTATLSGNTLDIKEATSLTYSGGSLASTTNGNTTFKVSGETTIDGVKSITIQATDTTNGDVNIYAKDALTETGKTVSITGTDSAAIKAATTTISGATTNVTGATTLNLSGGTINTNANTANTNATSAYTNISTATTVIGTANTTASTASLSGKTLTIDEKESISAKTPSLSVSATTINVTGATTVDGTFSASTSVTTPLLSATTISADVIHTESGLENPLSWSYGSVTNATAGSYNASGATGFTIPKTISDVSNGVVTSNASGLNVNGTITATGAIYSSDINLKENVQNVDYPTYANANGVAIRKFNFRNDESKRTMYGVIAQEVEIAGLEDIVVVKEDGFKGVDYTALSLLKIAYLENKVKELEAMIKKLTEEK